MFLLQKLSAKPALDRIILYLFCAIRTFLHVSYPPLQDQFLFLGIDPEDKIVKKVNFPISENNNDVSPGGGSTSSSTTAQLINLNNANCVEDWECSNWLDCVGGIQKKVCTDKNSCGTETNKPETEKECTVSQRKLGRGITGSVIGFAKSGVGTGLGMGILIILAGMGVIIFRNKKKAKKK